MTCIFCKIVAKEISAEIIYEDDQVMAIKDVNPQAPVHALVIPKKHIENVLELSNSTHLFQHILDAVKDVAHTQQIDGSGFRLVTNTGENGGQTVKHLHFHVFGGRPMNWPPG
ncbi:MAG: histidine triad (HIT) family protein [Candidatus Marinamargulisbacteria bacterium]|jgi:histidine triad (HIT) family protein